MSERKRIVFTLIAVGLVSIATGLFFHGELPPAQAAGLDRFDELVVTTTNKSVIVHGDAAFGQHEHTVTVTTTVTETSPHGDFPDYAQKMAPWAFTNATALKQGASEIWIYGREFSPKTLTVPAGTMVTWVNKSTEQHTVSSNDSLFDSIVYIMGSTLGSYSYNFTEPGTYYYYCRPHISSGMVGTIIVTPR